jgi:hypothetical protein
MVFHNPTRERVSEGRTREDVASDITHSLAYASGCDRPENCNLLTIKESTSAAVRVRGL